MFAPSATIPLFAAGAPVKVTLISQSFVTGTLKRIFRHCILSLPAFIPILPLLPPSLFKVFESIIAP